MEVTFIDLLISHTATGAGCAVIGAIVAFWKSEKTREDSLHAIRQQMWDLSDKHRSDKSIMLRSIGDDIAEICKKHKIPRIEKVVHGQSSQG